MALKSGELANLTVPEETYEGVRNWLRLAGASEEDPHLYRMLQEPDTPAPEGASALAVKMRETIVLESSRKGAQELGKLVEKARLQVR